MFHFNLLSRACLASLLLGAVAVCANEPPSLYQKDGRALTGSVMEFTNDVLIWNGADGNRQEIPLIDVDRLEFPTDSSAEPTENESVELESQPESLLDLLPLKQFNRRDNTFLSRAEKAIGGIAGVFDRNYETAMEGVALWTQRLEFGAHFRDGNSEEDFVDVGSKLERKDSDRMMGFEFGGQYARTNGQPTANCWFGNATIDLNRTGNWILFMANRNEFDEF